MKTIKLILLALCFVAASPAATITESERLDIVDQIHTEFLSAVSYLGMLDPCLTQAYCTGFVYGVYVTEALADAFNVANDTSTLTADMDSWGNVFATAAQNATDDPTIYYSWGAWAGVQDGRSFVP